MSISHIKEFHIPLPQKPVNLYVDDVRMPCDTYGTDGKGSGIPAPEWTLVRTVEDAKTLLAHSLVRVLSLDHDLGCGETGYDLIKWISYHDHWGNIQNIFVHSANPVGARNIKEF